MGKGGGWRKQNMNTAQFQDSLLLSNTHQKWSKAAAYILWQSSLHSALSSTNPLRRTSRAARSRLQAGDNHMTIT